MWRAWAVLLMGAMVAGCRPPAPAAVETPQPRPEPSADEPRLTEEEALERDIRATMTEMPAFEWKRLIPEPAAEVLRWPLGIGSHPELTPQFDVAAALAEPGLDWIALCKMGAHRRLAGAKLRDELGYLRAWCAVGKRDVDTALAELARLRSSVVRGLGPAVRADIANIIVGYGDARDAATLLAAHRLTDPDQLDLIAAAYLDLGKRDDGRELNALALGHDSRRNPTAHCRRLAKKIVLDPEPYRRHRIDNETLFGIETKDAECRRLEAELDCWLAPMQRCKEHFAHVGIHVGTASLILAADSWRWARSVDDWRVVVVHAIDGAPVPLAIEAAVAALENLSARTGCQLERREFRMFGQLLRDSLDKPLQPELAERLAWVEKYPPPYCK